MLLISCVSSLRPSYPNNLSTDPGTPSSVAFLSLISLIVFFHLDCLLCQCFESHDFLSNLVPLSSCTVIITSCSLKLHDLVTHAFKIFFLGLVCGCFQFVLQSSVVCPLCKHANYLLGHCIPKLHQLSASTLQNSAFNVSLSPCSTHKQIISLFELCPDSFNPQMF